jgi:transcriptional regulator with XRE-family HTH domain
MNESLETVTVSPERLRALRKERGLKLSAVAKEIGVTKSALSMYELGRQRTPGHVLARLSLLYNEPMTEFVEAA